jgi:hypothetical protein
MNNPIRPPNSQITPEAAEALAAQGIVIPNGHHDTDSEDIADDIRQPGEYSIIIPEPTFDFDVPPDLPFVPEGETGDSIPEVEPTAIVPPADDEPKRSRRTAKPSEPIGERDAKTGPPDIHEWMDFFSKIVLRVICDWYIAWAFSGVDEELLSDREIERIQLTDDERKRIARPFAELSYKSKLMRKHGRIIVASGGAFDAIVTIGAWASRVNRIARKYKVPKQRQARPANGRTGSGQPSTANGTEYEGTGGGRIASGYQIFNPGSS